MSTLHRLFLLTIAGSSLVWVGNQVWLAAEQPLSQPLSQPVLNAELNLSRYLNSECQVEVKDPKEEAEMLADPLFQAILQQFKEGRQNLAAGNASDETKAPSKPEAVDRLSSTQWQVVELILRAARILESEENRLAHQGKTNQRGEHQVIVKQLRANALKLIYSSPER